VKSETGKPGRRTWRSEPSREEALMRGWARLATLSHSYLRVERQDAVHHVPNSGRRSQIVAFDV